MHEESTGSGSDSLAAASSSAAAAGLRSTRKAIISPDLLSHRKNQQRVFIPAPEGSCEDATRPPSANEGDVNARGLCTG